MRTNDKRYYEVMLKWFELKSYDISIAQFFKDSGIKEVTIYGSNSFKDLLILELTQNDIIYNCINGVVDNIDTECVIILNFEDYFNIIDMFWNVKSVLSIKELIQTLHGCHIYYPKIRKKNEKCLMYQVRLPLITTDNDNPSLYESVMMNMSFNMETLRKNPSYFKFLYEDIPDYSKEYIENIFQEVPIVNVKNALQHIDYRSKFVNIVNGCRFTHNQPYIYKNIVHLFGNCFVYGIGTEDKFTLASLLQNKMQQSKVINYGVWGSEDFSDRILVSNIADEDIVILFHTDPTAPLKRKQLLYDYFTQQMNSLNIKYIELSELFRRPHDYGELLIDSVHFNHKGYRIIAEYLYNQYLKDISIYNRKNSHLPRGDLRELDLGFMEYSKYLENNKFAAHGTKGAIVMNCNPFTHGHRYLIERALEIVDFLYIFIVEEDKSFFKYEDRLELVQQNLLDLDNVKVLGSGKSIISTVTFPEYFTKDSKKNVQIDTSLDVGIFAEKIAPILDISARFAGKEPYCPITKQYNDCMREILPLYNIDFYEFERKQSRIGPISASKVRELMQAGHMEEIKDMVPEKTLHYLLNSKD